MAIYQKLYTTQIMSTKNIPDAYVLMLEKLDEINLALDRLEADSISKFAEDINSCLEGIKRMHTQIDLLNGSISRLYMEKILQKNDKVKKRIQDIVAIQRNELNLVRQGRRTAKGYAVHIQKRTGAIINSSN